MELLKLGACCLVLAVSLYTIVFRSENETACRWAYGAAGVCLGYLLR